MVLILDGNSYLGAHLGSNRCYLTCIRLLISSKTVKNRVFFLKRPLVLYACATCYELPSNISTMVPDPDLDTDTWKIESNGTLNPPQIYARVRVYPL